MSGAAGGDRLPEVEGEDGHEPDDASATSAADWGIAPRSSWMESNTKFGIALIVLLVCTLGFVVYKKMEKRRTELAASSATNPGSADSGSSTAGSERDRRTTRPPHQTAYDERDPTDAGRAQQPPARQSEPTRASDDPQSRLAAYRRLPAARPTTSQRAENPFDRPRSHPLRRTDQPEPAASTGDESNPFGPGQPATGTATQDATADSSAVTDLFDQPAETTAQSGESSTAAVHASPQPEGQATLDAEPRTAQSQSALGSTANRTEAHPDWSAAAQVQIRAATATTIQGDPSQATATAAEHESPWDLHAAGTAAQAVAAPVPGTPPFSTAQSGFEHVPRAAPPTHAAHPAGESPRDAVQQQSATAVSSGTATVASPFDDPPFRQSAPGTSPSTSRQATSQPPDFDFARSAAGAQSFAQPEDRPAVYIVRRGDNYWKISRRQYGTSRYYRALALYNSHRIPDPRRMQVGMKVLVPSRQILESRFPQTLPQRSGGASDAPHKPAGLFQDDLGRVLYRVGRNDTLGGIAQRHLGRSSRWTEIFQLNRARLASPTALKTGMELRLPADASRVRMVSEAAGRR